MGVHPTWGGNWRAYPRQPRTGTRDPKGSSGHCSSRSWAPLDRHRAWHCTFPERGIAAEGGGRCGNPSVTTSMGAQRRDSSSWDRSHWTTELLQHGGVRLLEEQFSSTVGVTLAGTSWQLSLADSRFVLDMDGPHAPNRQRCTTWKPGKQRVDGVQTAQRVVVAVEKRSGRRPNGWSLRAGP